MNEPKISVVMSTYNENIKWLELAIESILNQSFVDFEFIIVLDNPNRKDIKERVNRYGENDKRIVIIENESNLGLVKSLNRALKIAKGKYVARMDADDISYRQRLEVQFKFMEEHRDLDFLGANIRFVGEDGRELDYFNNSIITDPTIIRKALLYGNPLNHPTWFFKKSILEDLKEYREVPFAEDYDFLTRVITYKYNVGNLNETLLDYRMRQNGISQSNVLKQFKSSEYVVKMYKRRLEGKSDADLFANLNSFLNSNEGQEGFEKALRHAASYKDTRGIKKVFHLFSFLVSSNMYLKLFFKRRLYLFYLNQK